MLIVSSVLKVCQVFQVQFLLDIMCLSVRCVKLESGRLAEEVKDCGPVVDLEATPGCFLVKDGADPKADFPACCPVYECEEGTEVTN